MRAINVSLSELETKVLMIGFEGENQITQVRIDAAEILTDHPNATPTLIAKPLFGFAYPVIVTKEGTEVVWEIDNSVLSFNGDGEIQLTFTEGTVIAKSYVGRIRIKRSLSVNGEKPDPIETWEQAATAKLAEVDAQIGELEDMVKAAEAAKDEAQDIVDDAAADIQAAGAAQVQVVQAKGTEVLNSILADYTELSGDVSGLKSAINSIESIEPEAIIGKLGFVLGKAWNGNVGSTASLINSTYRVSNTIPVLLKPGKYAITITSGYRISYRTLNASNVIQADSGWKTASFEITVSDDEYYYAFTGGKPYDAAVTLEEFLQNVSINFVSNIVETVNGLTTKIAQTVDKQDALAVISFPGTGWAEVDTSAKTLTFPADTSIFANDNQNTRYNFATAQTISLASASSSMKIIFNPSTLEFSNIMWSTKIPDGCLLIGYYNSLGVANLVISCRYKIDGNPYGVDYRNILCAVTPPQAKPYVEFKTVSGGINVTFPADFSIFSPRGSGERYYTSEAQTVFVASSNSTLQKIYFNPSTGMFATKRYTETIPTGCYLIATIRTIPCTVTISCPYMVDGKMYNVSTASKEDQIVATANVKAVNHRGYNSVAPENTLPAFKLSKQNGFRYVETDVRFTSDNVPVLLHDTTINRTARNADGTEISGTINIADITYEQASAYDFGIWKGASYAGTKIPTLAEFMNLCRNIGLIPRVELNVLTVANAQTMFDVIDAYGMARKVEYNCNNIAVAQKFLELEPSATIVYGMGSYNAETVTSIGALKTANNTIIINMYYTAVSAELIAQCKQYGIELEIWVTDSESVIKNLDPFISGVSSDHVNASVVLYNSEMN